MISELDSCASLIKRSLSARSRYGIKLEGSTTILWVRDSYDVNLFGLGGAGDSFPGDPEAWAGVHKGAKYDFRVPSDVPR